MATLILAGGRSSRMGQDKALIPIYGVPLIRRVYEVAVQCCPPVYVISPWGDRYRAVLPDACRFIVEIVENTEDAELLGDRPHGPLVGFYQGLAYILADRAGGIHLGATAGMVGGAYPNATGMVGGAHPTAAGDWLLVLACDLPNLQVEVLQSWRDQLVMAPSSTIAALATHPTKGWQPLCGFYHRRCLPSLATFLAGGGRSFQRWLGTGVAATGVAAEPPQVYPLACSPADILFNCNTPEDLAHFHQFSQS